MKNLWAPWRMPYLQDDAARNNDDAGGCIFCPGLAADHDHKNLIVHRRPRAAVMMNKFPYNGGHLLILPLRHVPELDDLSPDELFDLFDTVRLARRALAAVMAPHGYNIGVNLGAVAGAGAPGHLHVHIVPRWHGDTNFMPVFGDVKVIPEDIFVTRDKLARVFAELDRRSS
jgi:ATP adenylyltransferase